MIRVVHVITDLFTGGAEAMLCKLLGAADPARIESSVIALTGAGDLAQHLRSRGIPLLALNMRAATAGATMLRLARELRRARPHVVQTWMYHADLLGGLAARAVTRAPVVWNIRCGRFDRRLNRTTTVWTARACAALSGTLPARIVCCSQAAMEAHAAAGYRREKMTVIPNGFDLDTFRPAPECRAWLRRDLGLAHDVPLVGVVARFDPAKDHATFCEAAALVAHRQPDAHFLLCGHAIAWTNPQLNAAIRRAGIASRCHLLGPRSDVPRLLAGLDVAVLSSVAEGFPNVVGEAMACGVPCAVTDAGDSRLIVGDTGEVVPAHRPPDLAAAILKLLSYPLEVRNALGAAARRRVAECFSLATAAGRYERLYEELTTPCAA